MGKKSEKFFASKSTLWLLFIPLASISKVGFVESLEYLFDEKMDKLDHFDEDMKF